MSDSTPSSASSQLPLKPLAPCMRQPAYDTRLLVCCEDPDCPALTHYVYIKPGDDFGSRDVWHLDMVRHLPDHIRCPEHCDLEYVDVQFGILDITLTFPGYTRTGTQLASGKRSHGPMMASSFEMEDLSWLCPYCDCWAGFIWSCNGELPNKCLNCEYERDATCVGWRWGGFGHEWDFPKLARELRNT